MTIPLPFTVGHRAYAGTDEDDGHGNEIGEYGDAVEIAAFWYAPPSSEPFLAGHDRVIVDLVVVVDAGLTISAHDLLVVDGQDYEVVAQEDYEHGPWWQPSRKPVNVRRIDG